VKGSRVELKVNTKGGEIVAQPMSSLAARLWYALDVDLEPIALETSISEGPRFGAREAVEYALMEAGALGTETNDDEDESLTVTAYFENAPDRERVRDELLAALQIYGLPSSAVLNMNVREVENRDWLEEWKRNWQPVEVGRFLIAPPWSDIGPIHDRVVIRIEPGMAFGTGTHETTRLCLSAIEKYFGGGSFLDVGTGTGILAIAAAKLFSSARIEACDTDMQALAIARENAAANNVSERIEFREGSVDQSTASFDLVCANLTAEVILALLPELLNVTCGRLILSGILNEQSEAIAARLHDHGISSDWEIMQDGDWACFVV
jgi:ribosomal protein L11 methyltransferase